MDIEIINLLKEVKSSPEEVEHWQIVLPVLAEEEKGGLLSILKEQKQAKQALATRQSLELVDLMKHWNGGAVQTS